MNRKIQSKIGSVEEVGKQSVEDQENQNKLPNSPKYFGTKVSNLT